MVYPGEYEQQGHARRDAARNKLLSQAHVLHNRRRDDYRASGAGVREPEVCPLRPDADADRRVGVAA